jgi:hypothetical protein
MRNKKLKKIKAFETYLTTIKCYHCGALLYASTLDNQHWCSNAECKKGLPFGLNK